MQSKMYLTRVSYWEREILLILRGEDTLPHVPDTHAHTYIHTHTHAHTHTHTYTHTQTKQNNNNTSIPDMIVVL